MVGSIDPRCETVRGTHWPKKGREVVWSSRRGNHLWPAAQSDRVNRPDIWMQAIRSDPEKTLVARGPSTYGTGAVHIWVPAFAGRLGGPRPSPPKVSNPQKFIP